MQSPSSSEPLRRTADAFKRAASYGRRLGAPFVLAVYAYLIYRISRDWPQQREALRGADISYLLLSLPVLVVALGVVASRWYFTLRALGQDVGWWQCQRVWFLSQAGRYLPGSIWPYVGRFYWAGSAIPPERLGLSLVLEVSLRISSEVVVAGLAVILYLTARPSQISGAQWMIAIAAAVLGLHLAALAFGPRLASLGPSSLKRQVPATVSAPLRQLGRLRLTLLLCYYACSVLLVGVAFWVFVRAFVPVAPAEWLTLTGMLAAATVIGFLAPFAPNGLGVREAVLTFLLALLMPVGTAAIISALSRLWLMAGEACWILPLALLTRTRLRAP